MKTRLFSLLAVMAMGATSAQAQLIYDFDTNLDAVFTTPVGTYSDSTDASDTWGGGDWFGVGDVSLDLPFAVVDESVVGFPGDSAGIISEFKTDSFFMSTDTVNGANADPTEVASWVFDISSLSGPLSFSVDMGAMGDFESSDIFDWEYSVDGSTPASLFTIVGDFDTSADYTMGDGGVTTLDDPLTVDGTILLNGLTTFTSSAAIPSGSSLTVTFTSSTDGGSEAYAFDTLVVSEGVIPEPGSVVLVLLGSAFAGMIRLRRVWG